MVHADASGAARSSFGIWLFRVLLVAAAAFMIYTWFSPWWSAKISVLPGEDHMVMRPWGIEVVAQVRANSDPALYSMPWIFTPFMWTYLGACLLALAASLFVRRRMSLGRVNLPLATLLIGLVGLSYLIAVGLAYEVAQIKAGWAGAKFVGTSQIKTLTGNKIKMISDLEPGYWLALAAGPVLIVLALLRGLFVGRSQD